MIAMVLALFHLSAQLERKHELIKLMEMESIHELVKFDAVLDNYHSCIDKFRVCEAVLDSYTESYSADLSV
jgi:hypothetical protein